MLEMPDNSYPNIEIPLFFTLNVSYVWRKYRYSNTPLYMVFLFVFFFFISLYEIICIIYYKLYEIPCFFNKI